MVKEICVESYLEAYSAFKRGADRIEFCDNLAAAGTTPSLGSIKKALQNIPIPIFVMIRPRGGGFCYSKVEVDIMISDILFFKEIGITNFVLGCLTPENEIDYQILKELMKHCSGCNVTFHKAIDEVENPLLELSKLMECGVNRVLSSGKSSTALGGKELLNKMIAEAKNLSMNSNKDFKVVVAGGVTRDNFNKVAKEIPNTEYHGKLIV